MAQPDIKILVGNIGDGALTPGSSGALILKNLTRVAEQISQQQLVKVSVSLDTVSMQQPVQDQLNALTHSWMSEPGAGIRDFASDTIIGSLKKSFTNPGESTPLDDMLAAAKNLTAGLQLLPDAFSAVGRGSMGLGEALSAIGFNPLVLGVTAAAAAIAGFVALVDACTVSLKEQREQTKRLRGEYSALSGELSNYSAQQETLQDRINVLSGQKSISITDQAELDRLNVQNQYLQAQIKLKEQLRIQKAQEANQSLKEEFGKDFNDPLAYNSLYQTHEVWVSKGKSESHAVSVDKEEYYNELIQKVGELTAGGDFDSSELQRYRDELVKLSGDYAAYAERIVIVDSASQQLYDDQMRLALAGISAAGGSSWDDTAESVDGASGALQKLTAQLAAARDGSGILKDSLEALDNGNLDRFLTSQNGANWGKLLNAFPNLSDELASYSAGLLSAEQLQRAFNTALNGFNADSIKTGVQNIVDACGKYGAGSDQVLQQVQGLESVIPGLTDVLYDQSTGLLQVDSSALSSADSVYSLLDAAIELQRAAAEADLTDLIAQYDDVAFSALGAYGSLKLSSGVIKDELHNRALSGDTRPEQFKAVEDYYDGLHDAMEQAWKTHASNASSNYGGSSAKPELYVPEIDQLYESSKQLKDIQNELNTLEAKRGGLDKADYQVKNELIKRSIELLETENGLLNTQNTTRRKMIEDGLETLRTQGFDIKYDPLANDLLIDNMEHLKELNVYGSGGELDIEGTNELRRSMEQLIASVVSWNDEAGAASLKWHQNAARNTEDALVLADSIKAAADAYLQDSNHEIGLMKRHGAADGEIIAKLEAQKDALHRFAEEIRKELAALNIPPDVIESLDVIQGFSDAWFEIDDRIKGVYQGQLDNLNQLIDLEKDLIKQEKEEQIAALETQKSAYADIIGLKKRSLELTERERSYQESLEESNSELARLQARADALALDDSRSAQLERGSLLEQIAERQKQLSDLQRDHSIEAQQDALDREQTDFESSQDDKIKDIRSFLEDNNALQQAALSRIDNMNAAEFDNLMAHALRYTDLTGAELESMWNRAIDSAMEYGSVTRALAGLNEASGGDTGADSSVASRIRAMRANSLAWNAAPPEERAALQEENKRLAAEISALIDRPVVVGAQDGVWYLDHEGGPRLYDEISNLTPASLQSFPVQQDGLAEMVASAPPQFEPLSVRSAAAPILPQIVPAGKPDVHVDASVTINGYTDEQMVSVIKRYPRKVSEVVGRVLLRS